MPTCRVSGKQLAAATLLQKRANRRRRSSRPAEIQRTRGMKQQHTRQRPLTGHAAGLQLVGGDVTPAVSQGSSWQQPRSCRREPAGAGAAPSLQASPTLAVSAAAQQLAQRCRLPCRETTGHCLPVVYERVHAVGPEGCRVLQKRASRRRRSSKPAGATDADSLCSNAAAGSTLLFALHTKLMRRSGLHELVPVCLC